MNISALSATQRQSFASDGYLVFRNFFPNPEEVLESLQQYDLSQREVLLDDDSPHAVEVLKERLYPLASLFISGEPVCTQTQISTLQAGAKAWGRWHMDGAGEVFVRDGTLDDLPFFQLICGSYFSESRNNRGELCVARGGHLIMQDYFRENEGRFWQDGKLLANTKKIFENMVAEVPMPEFTPVPVSPGDVLIAHAMLPHTVARNDGPIRTALYCRLGQFNPLGKSALTNIFSGFAEGIHDL